MSLKKLLKQVKHLRTITNMDYMLVVLKVPITESLLVLDLDKSGGVGRGVLLLAFSPFFLVQNIIRSSCKPHSAWLFSWWYNDIKAPTYIKLSHFHACQKNNNCDLVLYFKDPFSDHCSPLSTLFWDNHWSQYYNYNYFFFFKDASTRGERKNFHWLLPIFHWTAAHTQLSH